MQGKGALVTGGAGGIGRAVCERLAEEGATVGCLDINGPGAREVARQIGPSAFPIVADARDEEQVIRAVGEMTGHAVLDVLVNIIGGNGPVARADATPLDGWEKTQALNVRTTFLLAKHAVPYLARSRGCIVNMASALAFVGWPEDCSYGPTKAAIVQLTKGLAVDYGPHVRINCVCPGAVHTDMTEQLLDRGMRYEDALAQYGQIHPLHHRLAHPAEVADAVLFLSSDDASALTGVALAVDGGFLSRA
jgi:NAD(P)-dependent dehydrogenase (short-subunit alcohol dehydrogenase family)